MPADVKHPPAGFAERVIAWQRRCGRHGLPWQRTRDPYRVWLSEVMLQQTQVATVLPYYERFLARFPAVGELAAAQLDDVLALWSGLGYYSRARNLHRCAREVAHAHAGAFPGSAAALAQLPGIGRSTAAAIAAFCYGERAAILDGNVRRVLARVLAFDGDPASAPAQQALWEVAEQLLPVAGIEAYTQGLMDIGSTVCTLRAPKCGDCPLRGDCQAAASGEAERYPVRSRRASRSRRENAWLWLRWKGASWLARRPPSGVWGGLWSLCEFAGPGELDAASSAWPGRSERLPSFVHTLTHFDWTLHPVRFTLAEDASPTQVERITGALPAGRWFADDAALALGLPSPLRRLLAG